MAIDVDMGGNTLIVETIKMGATAPGQAGTELSTAELTFLDGATTTNNGTNKAVITGSSGNVTQAGHMTIMNATSVPAGGAVGSGYKFSTTANFGIFFGSGVPTLSAAQGSLYIRTNGTTTNDRMYVNTNGTTGWTAVNTVA